MQSVQIYDYAKRQSQLAIILSMTKDEFIDALYKNQLPEFTRAKPGDPDFNTLSENTSSDNTSEMEDVYKKREALRYYSRDELLQNYNIVYK